MKFVEPRPYADPEAAACKLLEIANGPFMYEHKGSPVE